MLSYSIVIRTLGSAGEKFRKELESIARQTVQPDRVLIYISMGSARPLPQIGLEEYVWTKKGMAAQRYLPYEDIDSDVLFLLDDDVALEPDSAEKLLISMESNSADCIAADTYRNHLMPFSAKMYNILANLVLPHWREKWAFIIRKSGSFSYRNNPVDGFCLSQTYAGPAVMIRKDVYDKLNYKAELWVDDLEYAYAGDMVEAFKLYRNGYRLGVLYGSGCVHLDAGSAVSAFKKSDEWMFIRTKSQFVIWWRTIFKTAPTRLDKIRCILSFCIKILWTFFISFVFGLMRCSLKYPYQFLLGLVSGWKFVHSQGFIDLPSYVVVGK